VKEDRMGRRKKREGGREEAREREGGGRKQGRWEENNGSLKVMVTAIKFHRAHLAKIRLSCLHSNMLCIVKGSEAILGTRANRKYFQEEFFACRASRLLGHRSAT
jgi:hypothetical protein